jgi:hypothetical protein
VHDSTNVYIGSINDTTIVNNLVEDQTIYLEQGSRGLTGPQGLQGPAGPGGVLGYYGSFYSTADQTLALNTPGAMTLGTTAEANGISIVSSSRITFAYPGTYDLQFSAQLHNRGGGGAGEIIDIWIAKNGTAIPDTAGQLHVASNKFVLPAWDYLLTVAANDYLELYWRTSNTQIALEYTAAVNPIPATPSVIVTVMQVMFTQLGPAGPTGATGATGATGPTGPSPLVNTDNDPGTSIYVGSIDPDVGYSLSTGDIWIQIP